MPALVAARPHHVWMGSTRRTRWWNRKWTTVLVIPLTLLVVGGVVTLGANIFTAKLTAGTSAPTTAQPEASKSDAPTSGSTVPSPTPSPKIEVVDTTITVPETVDPKKLPYLDIKLRNVGDQVAVIKSLTFEVRRFAKLQHCLSEGDLQVSSRYGVLMPTHPDTGDRIRVPISQELEPNTADRFQVKFRLPSSAYVDESLYFYVLRTRMTHDSGSDDRVDVGDIIVTLPFPGSQSDGFSEYFLTQATGNKSTRWRSMTLDTGMRSRHA